MWATLAWMTWLLLAPTQDAPGPATALAPPAERQRLRALGGDLARSGEREALERLREVLLTLGDDPEELARLAAGWERTLAGAKAPGARRAALADKLGRAVDALAAKLASETEPRRTELARALLALDSENA